MRDMGEPMEERLVEHQEVRRRTPTPGPGVTSTYGLPREVVDTAVRRLGFLGLVIALMGPSVFWVEYFFQPERVKGPIPPAVAALLFVVGCAVCILAWSRKVRPELVLDLGQIGRAHV